MGVSLASGAVLLCRVYIVRALRALRACGDVSKRTFHIPKQPAKLKGTHEPETPRKQARLDVKEGANNTFTIDTPFSV